jgi:ABC-type multidrug transport system fused ATPase/permease subunit
VMGAGQIIEQGSHVSLTRAGGVYAGLSQNQSLAKEMEIYF